MIKERCKDIISIVVCGSGIMVFGRIPALFSADGLAELRTAAKHFRLAEYDDDLVFHLVVKKVRICGS